MRRIPSFIAQLFKIFLAHLFLFFIIRVAFIFSAIIFIPGNKAPARLVLEAFLIGLRFDTTILCYLFVLPFILLFIRDLFNHKITQKITIIYFKITLPLALLVACADIPYYIQFQKHLSQEAFIWMNQGSLSIKLILSDFSYWGYLLLFFPLFYLSTVSINRFIHQENSYSSKKKHTIAFFITGMLLLFLGMRGRITGKTPIHNGLAYISDNLLVNQTGLNANFTLLNSLLYDDENRNLFHSENVLQTISKAKKYLDFKDTSATDFKRHIIKSNDEKKLNVVVVLMESMCAAKMGAYGQKALTPYLIRLSTQGLYFSDFYSAGIHTYNGIFSTITGFPALLHEHALEKYVDKKFNCLPSNLKQEGYQTLFFTTHDEQFDNMSGFLKYNGVDQIFSEKDFPAGQSVSTLGVPDHVMFDFSIKELNKQQQPFFALLLTSSDHGPWKIPTNIPFQPNGTDEKERATQYADWSIDHFLEQAKKQKWFDHTLFVFLGDHGVSFGHTYQMPLSFHHVPCIFYCPKFISPETNNSLSGQIDVFPTVMGLLGFSYENHSLGIDLLKEKRPCIYFSADNKIGCITDKYYYFDLLDAKQEFLYAYKNLSDKNEITEKKDTAALLKNYALTMLQTAHFLISNKKY